MPYFRNNIIINAVSKENNLRTVSRENNLSISPAFKENKKIHIRMKKK